jgi:DNA-binding response OmpR family regulator
MGEDEKTILIVEDEAPLRKVLTSKLKHEGFKVEEASDGVEGVKKALEIHPDLILLDVVMPRLDGIGVLKQLSKDQWGAYVPVILLTNVGDPIKVAEATEAGVSNMGLLDYLVKSDWKLDDVVTKVKQKLEIG